MSQDTSLQDQGILLTDGKVSCCDYVDCACNSDRILIAKKCEPEQKPLKKLLSKKILIKRSKIQTDISQLDPAVAIITDPGTRNLGYSIIKTKDGCPITMDTIIHTSTYEVIGFGLVDVKSVAHLNPSTKGKPITQQDKNVRATQSEIGNNISYHFFENQESPFVKTVKPLKEETKGVHDWFFYSENQEGISPYERNKNKYLADQLMIQCFVNGNLRAIMKHCYGISKIRFPGKKVKWGDSSIPTIPIPQYATDKEIEIIENKKKQIRKDFFVYFIMYYLDSTGQTKMLNELKKYNMDDRAHICDSICQGMRALMTDFWLELETKQNKGIQKKTTSLPSPVLTEKELEYVMAMLAANTRTSGLNLQKKEFVPLRALKKDVIKPKTTRKRKREEPTQEEEEEDEVVIVRKKKLKTKS